MMDEVPANIQPFPGQGAGAWIDACQEEMLESRDEAAIEAYTRILGKFAEWLSLRPGTSGQFHPQAMTRTAIEGFLDTLPSFSYKKQARAALSGFCRWLQEGHHPWQGVLDHCHSSEPAEERAIRFLETGGNTWG
jgi:hypothetical protein